MRNVPRVVLAVIAAGFLFHEPVLSEDKPRLVILLSVDQFDPQYLSRFKFTRGLGRLADGGVQFTDCNLQYALTETGPGHATMATGCFPSMHGIFENQWTDRRTGKSVYCVLDSDALPVDGLGGYRSPLNLRVSAVGDWLKDASPLSRVLSVSIKDRAAVLLGGKNPDLALWYDRKPGEFVSSSYYCKTLPAWVGRFNQSGFLASVPRAWVRLEGSCDPLTSPDSMPGEKVWRGSTAFPHEIPRDSVKDLLSYTPFGDSVVLALAREGLNGMQLGKRNVPDLLCISLSCTDYIGHLFGPNSVEMCDQLHRLDAYLGQFFDSIDAAVGRDHYAVVFSSDHSVHPLPEYASGYLGQKLARIGTETDIFPRLRGIDTLLRRKLQTDQQLLDARGFLNYEAAGRAGVEPADFEKLVAAEVRKLDFVADIFFRRELTPASASGRKHLDEWRKSYFAERGEDFVIDFRDDVLVTDNIYPAQHWYYCNHVPLMYWSASVQPLKVDRKVYSEDIAPSIGSLLGVTAPGWVGGKRLPEIH